MYVVIVHNKLCKFQLLIHALACIAGSTTLQWSFTRYSAVPWNTIPHIHFLWANWEVYETSNIRPDAHVNSSWITTYKHPLLTSQFPFFARTQLTLQNHRKNHRGSQSSNRECQIKVGSILNILTNINKEQPEKMNQLQSYNHLTRSDGVMWHCTILGSWCQCPWFLLEQKDRGGRRAE